MINYARVEGINLEDFTDLSTPVQSIQNLRAVPSDHFFELHERLDRLLSPGFSVRIGQQMKIEDYGVLGLSWRTCSRAGDIYERCERYFHLLSNTYVFKLEKEGALSKVHLYREAYRRGVELSNEATFSASVVVLKAITEKDIMPLKVSFKHNPPKDLSSYTDAFQCPILFNQSQNTLFYKTADLESRTAKADKSIHNFLLERVDEETKGMEVPANKITGDIEQLIIDALPSGIPGIGQISEHIGMSSRTLTRRLSENGISFREIIKQTQEKIAKDLLHNQTYTISEIAFQTGFSEQSAFSRAFKRWTGKSPLEYRNPDQ